MTDFDFQESEQPPTHPKFFCSCIVGGVALQPADVTYATKRGILHLQERDSHTHAGQAPTLGIESARTMHPERR